MPSAGQAGDFARSHIKVHAEEEKRDVSIRANADDALKFLAQHGDSLTTSGEDEARIVSKIDKTLLPLMLSCFIFQILDKILINYAAVMGLYKDASINTAQFSNLALFFYVSYLAFELPHGYMMQLLPIAKYLGTMLILWGAVVASTSACRSYTTLLVTRILLGCFESAVAPALILISAMWYKRSEQPLRVGIWYLGAGLATIFGSLISFGFQHYEGHRFTSWQIMFLVIGLMTSSVGVAVVILLPDNPMSSRLSLPEKKFSIHRVQDNQTGVEAKHFKATQAIQCLFDPQVYLFSVIMIAANVPNGAISSYQATIIENFGFTPKTSALLQIPSGAVNIIAVILATFFGGRYNRRGLNVITLLLTGMLGGALMAFLPTSARIGKLIGNYLTNCIGAALPLIYSWVAANFAGHTKKVTMNAILLMSFCTGNIIGPLTFRSKDAPDFIPAKITIMATCGFATAMTLLLVFYYEKTNLKREAASALVNASRSDQVNRGFLDLTDRENKDFRYAL